MANLSESLVQELKEMWLTSEKNDSPLSLQVIKLLDEKRMQEYLDLVRSHIGAKNSKVAGSIFIKRYALMAVMYLYTMTSRDEKLLISFENVSIVTDDQAENWLPNFYFSRLESDSAGPNRNLWRKNCIESLFKDHLYPIINCVAKVTKISKLILWENIAVYIFWLYETVLLQGEKADELIEQANEDFQFIILEAEGKLFGNYHGNPLKRFYKEKSHTEEVNKEIRQRSTCCYAYLTKSKIHCSTCPHACNRNEG